MTGKTRDDLEMEVEQLRSRIAELEGATADDTVGLHRRFLSDIIQKSQQPIGVGLPDGRLGFCNRAFCELTGYTAEELNTTNWSSVLTPPEWLPTEIEALRELERTGIPARYQKEYLRKNGTRVPIEVFVHLTRDKANNAPFYYAFVTDITERKQMEELLNETGDMARVGGWEIDLDTHTVRWSRVTKEIHEVPDDYEPSLERAMEFFPEVKDELTEAIRRAREEGEPYNLELPFVTAKGRKLWVHAIGRPEFRDGKCVRLHGTFQDITKIILSERRFRLAQEMSPDGFTILSPIRDESGQIVDFLWVYENGAAARFTGTDPEAVVGQRLLDLFPGQRDTTFFEAYQRVAETGEPYTFEESYVGESITEPTCFRVVVVPMDEEIAVLAQDTTERTHWERQIQASNQQLQGANRELEDFAYSVSHDLRAPLRAISGFANIIAERHQDELNEEGRHYFDNIVEATGKMGTLIEELLRFSRIGRRGVSFEPTDLKRTIDSVLHTYQEKIREKEAEIQVPEKLPMVRASQTQLEEIFSNLIGNALTYHRPESPPEVRITCEARKGRAVVAVHDNGIGIDQRFHDKVFNMFQRLHPDDQYPGTGIGLAIVKKSVALMGGRIWVESEKGRGSTFFVELRLTAAAARKE